MAVSNSRFNEFDQKSKQFVDKALDLIEEKFTGTKKLTAISGTGEDAKEFNLFLFN